MNIKHLAPIALLAGCAGSSAGLYERQPAVVLQSQREPMDLSACIATALIGAPSVIQVGADHYAILRKNGYGMPLVRYDVFKRDGSTSVEIRNNPQIGSTALDKVSACL